MASLDDPFPNKPPPGEPRADGQGSYQAGDHIGGKYRLTKLLGIGGMGAVWAARNELLEIDVAIKFLRAGAGVSGGLERFLQEARAAAKLGHASIVRVLDYGHSPSGDPYLVMELLEGPSLAEMLERQGRLPAIDAVQLILPVCSALEAAHHKGIVHRDLKPDNILVLAGENDRFIPKLVDFGIAKLVDPPGVTSRPLTSAGSVLGTPDYMSPEQARGRVDVDGRSDVWSLCVVLFEMVSGRRPFQGENYLALLQSIIADHPPTITSLAAGDQALSDILQRGLTKDPDLRWQSMRDLGRALATWCLGRGVDTDSAGASLGVHWLQEGRTSRSSGSGPRLSAAPLTHPTLDGKLGSTSTAPPVESSTSSAAKRKTSLPAMIGVVVGFVALASLSGWIAIGRRTPTPVPAEPTAAVATQPPAADGVPTPATPTPSTAVVAPSPPEPAVASADPPRPGKSRPPAPKPKPTSRDMPVPTGATF